MIANISETLWVILFNTDITLFAVFLLENVVNNPFRFTCARAMMKSPYHLSEDSQVVLSQYLPDVLHRTLPSDQLLRDVGHPRNIL